MENLIEIVLVLKVMENFLDTPTLPKLANLS